MTDKQIMIDSVDVSGCEFYLPYSEKCECIVDDNGNNNLFCREYRDCYYKRMYHTGQEKDIYKNENKELYKLLKAKEQECEGLRYEIGSLENGRDILQEQLDQLKVENEELRKNLVDKHTSRCFRLLTHREFDKLIMETVQLRQENKKLKQTLTEIKEIAEKCCIMQATLDCENYDDCTQCGRISDGEGIQQILQKISEVEE